MARVKVVSAARQIRMVSTAGDAPMRWALSRMTWVVGWVSRAMVSSGIWLRVPRIRFPVAVLVWPSASNNW